MYLKCCPSVSINSMRAVRLEQRSGIRQRILGGNPVRRNENRKWRISRWENRKRARARERFVIRERTALKGYAYGSCYLDHRSASQRIIS